jgi:hypothetical protein
MGPPPRQGTCSHCGNTFDYHQYHAGFSGVGYMYCDVDETVLTWSAYSPIYRKLIDRKVPWALDEEEQTRVERALKPCPNWGAVCVQEPAAMPGVP